MKKKFIVIASLMVLIGSVIISCSKSGGSNSTSSGCKMTSFVQGTVAATDTVYTYQFDNNNRISRIFEHMTGYNDTFPVTYDVNNNIIATSVAWGSTSYSYNTMGLLSQVSSQGNTYSFVYNSSNQPVFITENESGTITYDSVTFNANGDASIIKLYDASHTLNATLTCQYTTDTNTVKTINLINFPINMLGLNEISYAGNSSGTEIATKYFSKHFISSVSNNHYNSTVNYTYQHDNLQRVISSDCKAVDPGVMNWEFTRSYVYTCN